MWFIGVEIEQETSAPPPKKNPVSAHEVNDILLLRIGKGLLLVSTKIVDFITWLCLMLRTSAVAILKTYGSKVLFQDTQFLLVLAGNELMHRLQNSYKFNEALILIQ